MVAMILAATIILLIMRVALPHIADYLEIKRRKNKYK